MGNALIDWESLRMAETAARERRERCGGGYTLTPEQMAMCLKAGVFQYAAEITRTAFALPAPEVVSQLTT